MRVIFDGEFFVCHCAYPERGVPRLAGFRWNPKAKYWYTPSPTVATRLREFHDETARKELNRILIVNTPWAGRKPYAPKGLVALPFQLPAAEFALNRNRSYLALDPGLGKTPIAAMILNAERGATVFISPPFLMRNVEAELSKWTDYGPKISQYQSQYKEFPDILIIPDSLIGKDRVKDEIHNFLIHAKSEKKKTRLFVDEAHRYKTPEAQRTRALFGHTTREGVRKIGLIEKFDTITYLSGTPVPNRPMELFPVLSSSAKETIDFQSKFEFGRKYCSGHRTEFGWDFSGASNMKELASRVIGPFMLRLKKADVLKDLPPKTEELVFIGDNLPAHVGKMDLKILEKYSPEDLMEAVIARSVSDGKSSEIHIATYRKELGIAKVDAAVTFIDSMLSETNESILVFAFHKTVISELVFGLSKYKPLVITGETPTGKRQDLVDEFQTRKEKRLFIGNYLACGVGFTLTKATRVIFVEFAWTPAENDQASDRAHRIGQRDNVFVQYLVYKNSIDKAVIETIFRKRNITKHV